jgi:hypothetical protein
VKTYKVTLVIKVENEEDIKHVVPSVVDGMQFDEHEGVVRVEIEECINEQL